MRRSRVLAVSAAALALAGCAGNAARPGGSSGSTRSRPSSAASSSSGVANACPASTSTVSASPPMGSGGAPSGGGAPPGGGGSTPTTGTGAFTLDGGTAARSNVTISAAKRDESGVLVRSGALTLSGVTVRTTGSSSSSDASSFYGLDAGVLALASSYVNETGGSVTTSGDGANAVFAYGDSAAITIAGTTVRATGRYAHGIMASGGGTITATDLTVTTAGASSAAVATDRGGGTIVVSGGSYRTDGTNSPGLYSTGTLTIRNATVLACGAEAAVIEGSNTIAVVDSTLTGNVNRGVMLYQSMSGDAQGVKSTYAQAGGSLSAASGPLFYVTNAHGTVGLSGVALKAASGTLLQAAAGRWGTSGANGGIATLKATSQRMTGDIVVDALSTAAVSLTKGSTLTGAIDAAHAAKRVTLSLDASSTWTVTRDSYLTSLTDAAISGTSITNIVGNGHTVHYRSASSPVLGGKTYRLRGGGALAPG